jgi:aryl carrier-like protein
LKLSLPRTGIKTAPHVLSFGFFKLWMAQKSLSVHDSANISRTGLSSVKVEDTIEYFRKVHDQVKHETIDSNAKYKAFVAGRSPLKLEIWCELCLLVINFL